MAKTESKQDIMRQQTEPDWRGQLSPFRTFVDIRGANVIKNSNHFGLTDYVWYPEGIKSKYKEDYFDTLSQNTSQIDASSSDGGAFTGVSIDDVSSKGGLKNVVNKTSSYAKNQISGTINSVKGLRGKKSSESIKGNTTDKSMDLKFIESIPQVKIYEFQPNSAISEMVGGFKGAFKKFDAFFASEDGGMKRMMSNIGSIFTEGGLNDMISELVGEEDFDFSSAHGKIIDVPNFFYTNLIGGFYSGSYIFPFYKQSDYLHGMGDAGWESKSLKQRLLPGPMSSMIDSISEAASSFDIAGKPKWTMDGSGPAGDTITFELPLFNHTLDDTVKNIKMIHSIVGGNMWVQNVLLQLAPCLYDIEVEGRYRYFFCKADVKVEVIGKQRIPSESFKNQLQTMFDKGNSDFKINDNAFKFIPDAYKMTIVFTSLIPNNFNTYLNYIMDGVNKVDTGDIRASSGNKALQVMMNKVTDTSKTTGDNPSPPNNDLVPTPVTSTSTSTSTSTPTSHSSSFETVVYDETVTGGTSTTIYADGSPDKVEDW